MCGKATRFSSLGPIGFQLCVYRQKGYAQGIGNPFGFFPPLMPRRREERDSRLAGFPRDSKPFTSLQSALIYNRSPPSFSELVWPGWGTGGDHFPSIGIVSFTALKCEYYRCWWKLKRKLFSLEFQMLIWDPFLTERFKDYLRFRLLPFEKKPISLIEFLPL